MIRFLSTFLLLLFCFSVKAQEPVSVNLSEKDGLPDKEIYSIIEDSKGFIWLSADKGLFRYDGKLFKTFSNAAQRGLSVFGVQEDATGRIWCNNISGQFFYVEGDQLITFTDLSAELKGNLATFLVKKDFILVFSLQKIYFINLKTKEIDKIKKFTSNVSQPFEENNRLYITGSDALNVWDNNTNFITLFDTKLPSKENNITPIITGDSQIFKLDSILFYRQIRNHINTFFEIDISENRLKKVAVFTEVGKEKIHHIFENEHQIWIATTNGVWIYNYANQTFILERQFLKGKNVTKTIKDKDGNYWFTTLNNGMYVMPNIYIEQYPIAEDYKNISSLDKIDENTLLFGSNNGNVGCYNLKTNTETTIKIPNKTRVSAVMYNPKNALSYVGKDTDGFILDVKTKLVKSTFKSASVKSFSALNNNDVLVLNFNNTKLLKYGENNVTQQLSASRRPYTSFYSKKTKFSYVGYVDGFIQYDSLWKPKTIRNNGKDIFCLSITETSDGILWIGTFKDGIFGIKDDAVLYHFTTENGLSSNRIEKIKADNNDVWIATENGIQKLDTHTKVFKTLTKRDGIISYDISGIEILGNTVVFSSSEGLFGVHKTKAFKKQQPSKVYFTQIEINEKPVSIKSTYELDYDQNAIKIGFNVNGFQFGKKGKYQYKLVGFNDTWITTNAGINSQKYSSLPAGKYTFQVKPILDIENEKSAMETFSFFIKKPFWKRWWFIGLLVVLVLSSIVYYFRRKIKKEEVQRLIEVKQLSLDKQLIALKLENLRSQMNPHFIFNALNSIQEYIVLNQKKLASEYLGKFADLIRTYLNHSTKGKITLQEEINCLEMYLELEKLRFEDKLKYTINTLGTARPEDLNIPTMLIQPYVENALKHGLLHRKKDRVLNINFNINSINSTIECTIIDNGVGREKAAAFKERSGKNYSSFATKATQDRLALLNYGKEKQVGVTITDLFDDEKPTGTQVAIIIPFTTH